jgi:hypothetical protein
MISTIIKLGWLNLSRDRVAQALTFLLPILFFSIFASVFGGQNGQTSRIRVAVVDEDHSELSARVVAGLGKEEGLRVRTTVDDEGAGGALGCCSDAALPARRPLRAHSSSSKSISIRQEAAVVLYQILIGRDRCYLR